MKCSLLLAGFLLLFFTSPCVFAGGKGESMALQQEQIDAKFLIKQGEREEWGQLETLKALNRNLRVKSKDVRLLARQVRQTQKGLERLRASTESREKRISLAGDRLNRKLGALFYFKKIRQLTLLPGQSDFANYFRNQRHLQKLSTTDAQEVLELQKDLEAQRLELAQLQEKVEELEILQESQKRQQLAMEIEQKQIKNYLKLLRHNRKAHRGYLREINKRLRQIDSIAKSRPLLSKNKASKVAAGPKKNKIRPFTGLSKLRHKLENPVTGRLVVSFNSSQKLYKKGVLVKTEPDTQAKAVWIGKVVFAGAFEGLGNMVMIDHGRGSLSIYGNLEDLKVKKGDQVKALQALGQVSQVVSPRTGYLLYFEIRHRKRSVNPKKWLLNPTWN